MRRLQHQVSAGCVLGLTLSFVLAGSAAVQGQGMPMGNPGALPRLNPNRQFQPPIPLNMNQAPIVGVSRAAQNFMNQGAFNQFALGQQAGFNQLAANQFGFNAGLTGFNSLMPGMASPFNVLTPNMITPFNTPFGVSGLPSQFNGRGAMFSGSPAIGSLPTNGIGLNQGFGGNGNFGGLGLGGLGLGGFGPLGLGNN